MPHQRLFTPRTRAGAAPDLAAARGLRPAGFFGGVLSGRRAPCGRREPAWRVQRGGDFAAGCCWPVRRRAQTPRLICGARPSLPPVLPRSRRGCLCAVDRPGCRCRRALAAPRPKRPPRAGAAASSARHSSSVSVFGSRSLGILAFFILSRDVRPVAAVEHLDVVDAEVLDDAIGIGLLLQADAPRAPAPA